MDARKYRHRCWLGAIAAGLRLKRRSESGAGARQGVRMRSKRRGQPIIPNIPYASYSEADVEIGIGWRLRIVRAGWGVSGTALRPSGRPHLGCACASDSGLVIAGTGCAVKVRPIWQFNESETQEGHPVSIVSVLDACSSTKRRLRLLFRVFCHEAGLSTATCLNRLRRSQRA